MLCPLLAWHLTLLSGLHNSASAPLFDLPGNISPSFLVWNARALCFGNHNCRIRKQKAQQIAKFCKTFSIVGILEAKGAEAEIKLLLSQYIKTHFIFSSVLLDEQGLDYSRGGGVVLLVRHSLFPISVLDSEFNPNNFFRVIIPGRVLRLTLPGTSNGHSFALNLIHNQAFSREDFNCVEKVIRGDISKSREAPCEFCSVSIGDFNLQPAGVLPLPTLAPIPPNENVGPQAIVSTRPFQARWEKLFQDLTEIVFAQQTHYNPETSLQNKIDRIFVATSRPGLTHMKHSAGTISESTWWYSKGLSDHAPVFWHPVPLKRAPGSTLRLKKEWCEHPDFAKRVAAFSHIINNSGLPLAEKREAIIRVQRESAIMVRDKLFLDAPESQHSLLTRLASISRAIWYQDVKLASILILHSELGARFLKVDGGKVVLLNPTDFESQFVQAKEVHYQNLKDELARESATDNGNLPGAANRAQKRSCRMAALNRLSFLWNSFAPKLALGGVIIDEELANAMGEDAAGLDLAIPITDPQRMAKAIGTAWANVFGWKPTDDQIMEELLLDYANSKTWDWSLSSPPTFDSIVFYLSKLKHCQPGIDGMINAAWKNSGDLAAKYIVELLDLALSGGEIPHTVLDGLYVFINKGDHSLEEQAGAPVVRKPTELRPLTLKVADNKIVMGVLNHSITPTISACASALQRGFVPGRQLLQNAVDLDFWTRKFAMLYHESLGSSHLSFDRDILECLSAISGLPIAIMFDYAAAFPSVAHAWMFAILHYIKIPKGFLNAVKAMYKNNQAYTSIAGIMTWIFIVACGVLQGCPLSGTLFVLAIDPLLHLFERFVCSPGHGAIYACADDIGAALSEIRHLKILHKWFTKVTKASGLILKPAKCVLVLTTVSASEHNISRIREWLAVNIPEWSNFQIRSSAKYLGIHIGPKLGGLNWYAPICKFVARTEEVANRHLPLALASAQFASKALSVLGYVGQLMPPPKNFKVLELRVANKILRVATNSFTTNSVYQASKFGGPALARPAAYLHATRIRGSAKTFSGFSPQHFELKELALKANTLCRLMDPRPDGWDSDAFCSNLHQAYMGIIHDSDFPGAELAILDIINQYRNGDIKSSLQKKIFRTLSALVPSEWQLLLSRRASKLEIVAPLSGFPSPAFLKSLLHIFKSLPAYAPMAVLRTWTNGWFTTHRMHENIRLSCILGCEEPDSLKHYLQCNTFWSILGSAGHRASLDIDVWPSVRCCLCNPSRISVSNCMIAFLAYHAIRNEFDLEVRKAAREKDFTDIQVRFLEVCSYHFKDSHTFN